jgi:cytochrome c
LIPVRKSLALAVVLSAICATEALAAAKAPPPAKPSPVAAVPAGDPANGKKRFKAICESCHFSLKDATINDLRTKIGPNLWGVVGRKAGTGPSFRYSQAMKASGVTWTPAFLKPYLMNPQKTLPNVRMAFKGLPTTKDADDIIAYLATQK